MSLARRASVPHAAMLMILATVALLCATMSYRGAQRASSTMKPCSSPA